MPELTRERRAALAHFYRENEAWLVARLWPLVHSADRAIVIADACSYAWLQLVRRPDVRLDRCGLSWLTLVATQEAWRLEATRRDLALLSRGIDHADEYEEPAGPAADPLELAVQHETHGERVARLATLKPREQRDLLLQAAGYSYAEIAVLTASTRTAVNRRLSEGRARLHGT